MVSWAEFESQAPELAGLCLERFRSSDLVMLGTLRKDGFPRISPIEFAFYDGDLMLGGSWGAKKALDLLRDERCTIHSTTSNKDGKQGDAKLWAMALPFSEERAAAYWQWVFEQSGWRPDRPYHLFGMDIQSAAFIRFDERGAMRRLQWPGDGVWIVKPW